MTGDQPGVDPVGPGVVSRETVDRHFFGDRLALAKEYAEVLRTDGITRGLIGPREAHRIWERHVLNCAALAPELPADAVVADIGSGAGLPGLVLAIARPDISMRLVEPLLRRATFLSEVVETLGLTGVEVIRERAEQLAPGWEVDVVTARAVAPLPRLAGWCLPLLRPGGELLAMKGERAADELSEAAPALPGLGAAHWEVRRCGGGLLEPPVRVVVIRRRAAPGTEPVHRSTRR